MSFTLLFTPEADTNLKDIERNKSLSRRLKAVYKALAYLEANPRHPSLNMHKYESLTRKAGFEVFEAYAENHTPQAYRIFWRYGPQQRVITVIAITAHP